MSSSCIINNYPGTFNDILTLSCAFRINIDYRSKMKKYFLSWSWRRNLHVPVLIALEVAMGLLYAYYVRFDSPISQVSQQKSFLFLNEFFRKDGIHWTLCSMMSMWVIKEILIKHKTIQFYFVLKLSVLRWWCSWALPSYSPSLTTTASPLYASTFL